MKIKQLIKLSETLGVFVVKCAIVFRINLIKEMLCRPKVIET